jgi:hypothetical protein
MLCGNTSTLGGSPGDVFMLTIPRLVRQHGYHIDGIEGE